MSEQSDPLQRAERRADRERAARRQAEQLLEAKSWELHAANVSLQQLAEDLEEQVAERTRELAAALEAASSAAVAKSQFLAAMSHEIRTPLFGIIGTADVLRESALTAVQAEQVSTIRSSGESLLTLLNEILDFSKLDAARVELDVDDFDLVAESYSVTSLYRPLAAQGPVVMHVDIDDGVRTIHGDKLRYRQILSNLISNAVKFTSEGEIWVRVGTREIAAGVEVILSVRDTGPGIPPEHISSLFDEFSQGDPSVGRTHGGTGLGLAIVSRLVQLMGGEIQVESEVGVGSTFTARMIMGNAQGTGRAKDPVVVTEELQERPDLGDLRILLVEDEVVNRTVATAMLGRLGIRPSIAQNGLEAVDAVAAQTFDLVLIDLHMPVLGGIDATRRIRALDGIEQPRIVAVTASAFESDRRACTEAGMDDFLPKPFTLNGLQEVCVRAVHASR